MSQIAYYLLIIFADDYINAPNEIDYMNILIVEDEVFFAKYYKKVCSELLDISETHFEIALTYQEAFDYLKNHQVDLLLLDLYLNGNDGFELLKYNFSKSLNIIVISAKTERAIEAFKFGVIDFVEKPFTKDRFKKAIDRYKSSSNIEALEVLNVRTNHGFNFLRIKTIKYF